MAIIDVDITLEAGATTVMALELEVAAAMDEAPVAIAQILSVIPDTLRAWGIEQPLALPRAFVMQVVAEDVMAELPVVHWQTLFVRASYQ